MAYQFRNRIRGTSTTTGTGTYTVEGPPEGFQGFDTITSGREVHYCVVMGEDWEVGIGTVTVSGTTTLSRDTIINSSNSDSAVNWGSGEKEVFVAPAAEALQALWYDGSLRHGDFDGTLKAKGIVTAQGGVNVAGSIEGTANAITGILTPAIDAYGDGMLVVVEPASNNTSSATLALNGLTARSIVTQTFHTGAMALAANDLVAGIPALLVYDLTNTRWILLNPAGLFRRVSPPKVITSVDSPYTAVAGDNIFANTTGGAITVTLPASPAVTDAPIRITYLGGSNTLTVGRNGKPIMALAEDMTIPSNGSAALQFIDNTFGWRLVASV